MKWSGYQRTYLADRSPRKAYLKARRIGVSEVVAFEIACRACGAELWPGQPPRTVPPVPQSILASGLVQSTALLRRVLHHVKAIGVGFRGDLVRADSATKVTLANGVDLRAFGHSPEAIRSFGGDLTWDECAATPNSRALWHAAKPIADAHIGRPEGYQTRIISTPLGDDNLFYDVCRGALAPTFSLHTTTIHDAARDGFPADIDRLREEAGDEDAFAQEYECSFLSADARYISAEMYDRSLHTERPDGTAAMFAGMDVARKRDMSAIVRLLKNADTFWHLDTDARKGETWDEQEAWVDGIMGSCSRLHVDSTGLGSQFAERMASRWLGRVTGVDFTAQSKESLATGLRLALERGRLRMRADDVDTRRDVLNLRRIITKAGNVRFDAPVTKHGHADRAWALALAVDAGGGVAQANTGVRTQQVPSQMRAMLGQVGPERRRLFDR